MRQPLLSRNSVRLQTSKQKSTPAPTGGLNARDAYFSMPEGDAIEMFNIFPNSSYCEVRYGSQDAYTGMTGTGKTLATYTTLTGTQELYFCSASGIYDTSGTLKLARTVGKNQIVQMGDGTNNWLMLFNGTDKPAYYNGTTWTAVDGASTPALTGVTTTGLICGMTFKGRLFLGEKDKLKFWYLAAGAVGGALSAFDLTAQASRGGYLTAMTNWTIDGGGGIDDRAVFITSEGEVIVYQGTDPAVAADWAKVGTFYFGKPLGRNCLCKFGGDVLVLTESGIISVAGALSGIANESKFKITDKIRNLYTSYAKSYGSTFGWQAIVYEAENALIVNVPVAEDGAHYQLVMNTITGAWCQFGVQSFDGSGAGWKAENFAVFNKQLYYTRSTKIVKAWDRTLAAQTDEGTPFLPSVVPAFLNFGTGSKKQVRGVSLSLTFPSNAGGIIYYGLTDYSATFVSASAAGYTATASTSDRRLICPPYKPAISVSLRALLSGAGTTWTATDWLYEPGGPL